MVTLLRRINPEHGATPSYLGAALAACEVWIWPEQKLNTPKRSNANNEYS
jgi:hypothetical protein